MINRIDEDFEPATEETETEDKKNPFDDVSVEIIALTVDFLIFTQAQRKAATSVGPLIKSTKKLVHSVDAPEVSRGHVMIVQGMIEISQTVGDLIMKMEAMSLLLMYHQQVDDFSTVEEFFLWVKEKDSEK